MPSCSPNLWTPNLGREPQAGDMATSRAINKPSAKSRLFIWTVCPKCGLARWIDKQCYLAQQEPKGQCRPCAHAKSCWHPSLNRPPQIGEETLGKYIGKTSTNAKRPYIWASCPKCGISRWVHKQYYFSRAKLKGQCRACTHSKTDKPREYWIPSLGKLPQAGDETKGKYISQPVSENMAQAVYVWVICPTCTYARWLVKDNHLAISQGKCPRCRYSNGESPKPYWTPESGKAPQIGDETQGKYIGKLRIQRCFVFAACPTCGVARWIDKSFFKKSNSELRGQCHKCFCASQKGIVKPSCLHRWKDGNGYIRVKLPPSDPLYCMTHAHGGYVLEHRLVVARAIGRPLTKQEVVHHKNNIRDDNRFENLELTPSCKTHGLLTRQCQECPLQKEVKLLRWQTRQINERINELKNVLQGKLNIGNKYAE